MYRPTQSEVKRMAGLLKGIYGASYNWDDSLDRTSERLLKALGEFQPTKQPFKATTFVSPSAKGMISCGPITFSSICKHHMWPYSGHAWVGYISSGGRIVGLSKLPRMVKWLAKRPTTQEELTTSIVRWLDELIEPKGVIVVIEAIHTCMSCRGVQETDARMVTSLPSGVFIADSPAREEFLHFVNGG